VGIAELHVPPFATQWESVGPKNPQWKERIKLEIYSLKKYIDYLASENSKPWFKIMPDMAGKIPGVIWRGFICVPSRPEIKFDLLIVLSGEYPRVPPKAFIEDSVIRLAGSKIYVKNRFPPGTDSVTGDWHKDPQTGKSFVMICHDHMAELENAWNPSLGIVHFFIREIWYWFAAMQNFIIEDYDKENGNIS